MNWRQKRAARNFAFLPSPFSLPSNHHWLVSFHSIVTRSQYYATIVINHTIKWMSSQEESKLQFIICDRNVRLLVHITLVLVTSPSLTFKIALILLLTLLVKAQNHSNLGSSIKVLPIPKLTKWWWFSGVPYVMGSLSWNSVLSHFTRFIYEESEKGPPETLSSTDERIFSHTVYSHSSHVEISVWEIIVGKQARCLHLHAQIIFQFTIGL